MKEISYDELHYLVREKNEDAEILLFKKTERYLKWISYAKSNDFLRQEDILSYGWQGYQEAINCYDPMQKTKFKTFMEFCIQRRLIDVQRRRNRGGLKGHMNGLLISDEKVAYAVDRQEASFLTDDNLIFDAFWKKLTEKERMMLKYFLRGDKMVEIAVKMDVSSPTVYQKIKKMKHKLQEMVQKKE
ncbi:hypothetical protein AwErysi_08260 [Erysipelotrichaceae bacterium]|nr:hypothetical protein AwErysi_08260 [Erysipelotrichaceae bacterium]